MERRVIFGTLLIVIGCLFLLDNLGIVRIPNFIFSWPTLLLVLAGFNALNKNYRNAGIFFFIGLYFLLDQYYYLNIRDWWPVFLIAFGLLYLFKNKSKKKEASLSGNYFDEINIFGGNDKQIINDQLEGGKTTTVFGGTNLDFTESKFLPKAVINTVTIFGGTEIKLPPETQARVNVISILGGFDDKRMVHDQQKSPQITIKGFTLFGGTEIKD